MNEKQQFGEYFLKSVLESRPGTPEELSEKKRLIDSYFLHLEEERKSTVASAKNTPSNSTAVVTQQELSRVENLEKLVAATSTTQDKIEADKTVRIVVYCWASFMVILSLTSLVIAQPVLPVVFLAPCLLVSLCVERIVRQKNDRKSTQNHTLDREAASFDKKKSDYDCYFHRLLNAGNLRAAYDPAEECLGLLKYLQKHDHTGLIKAPLRAETHGHEIDPVHTLIERLIDDHQLEEADQLSRLYLRWLNPEFD